MSSVAAPGAGPGISRARRSLTICGSGNGAHALAVVASQTLDGPIDWLVGSEEKADALQRAVSANPLRSTGVIAATADRLRTISADPALVIPDADMVIVVVPAFAHSSVLRRIAPHLNDATILGCMPTRGGFDFEAAHLAPRDASAPAPVFGVQTLPWSTRVTSFGEIVHIGAAKAEVVLAALPGHHAPALARQLSQLIGTQMLTTESFLSLTLANPGQFIHPGLMYGHFHGWDGQEYDEETIPMLYAEASDDIADVVARLSQDAVSVAREIEERSERTLHLSDGVIPIHEWLRRAYSRVTGDTSTVGTCFRTGPIQARKAPMIEIRPGKFVPNFEYRYLTEDVPYGLVVTRAIADLVGVETPTIDEVIDWTQAVLHRSYLVEGELRGADASDLPIPQNYGITEVHDLIEWYRDGALHTAERSDLWARPA
jgi:predicted dinucleotide-binding enzyme